MSAEQWQWSDERFLRKACDQMAAELDRDSLDSGRLHRATCAARTLAGEPVIVGVLDHAELLSAVLKDAEQERGRERLPVGTPIWLYVPAGLTTPSLPATVVVRAKIDDVLNVDSETWLLVLDDGRYLPTLK